MADALDTVLSDFFSRSRFGAVGGVVTDLDGTAVHEEDGRIAIAPGVVEGLRRLREGGRPIVLNTLRFPLNVVRSFGRAWYEVSSAPMPLVSLNGAVLGELDLDGGEIVFRERAATPLSSDRIRAALGEVEGVLSEGIEEVLLFFYPRDWRRGEIIWTPRAGKREEVAARYSSASEILSCPLDALEARLRADEPCMIFFLIHAPADRLMAYQHARPASFLTAEGVDKLSGARTAAAVLGFDLQESVGAGDTPMDSFLAGVGLGIHVGPATLDFRAHYGDLRLASVGELGALLQRLQLTAPVS